MGRWRYRAASPSLASQHGVCEAPSAAEARARLRGLGLEVLELVPSREGAQLQKLVEPFTGAFEQHLRARRRSRLADALEGLATLLRSGSSAVDALETTRRDLHGRDRQLDALLERTSAHVRGGGTLAGALAQEPRWCEPVEIAVLGAAERTGRVPEALDRLAGRRERSSALQARLAGVLAYPLLVAGFGLVVAAFLGTRTLPQLAGLLEGAGVEVPFVTQAVMVLGDQLVRHGAIFLLGALGVFAGLWALHALMLERWGSTALIRLLDARGPRVAKALAQARFARGLAQLLSAGVPWAESLGALKASTKRGRLRQGLEAAKSGIEEGLAPAQALRRAQTFDGELSRLVELGARSGEIERLLERYAERTERRADRAVDRLVAWIEPFTVLTLAFAIGVVAMAAVLPLVRLQEVF
jgi:type II secretory pathway component PulF